MKRAIGFALVITALALGSTNLVAAAPGDGLQQIRWQFRLGEWFDQLTQWMGPGSGNCQNGDCDQDQDRTRDRLRTHDCTSDCDPIQARDRDRDRLHDGDAPARNMIGPRDGSKDCPYGN